MNIRETELQKYIRLITIRGWNKGIYLVIIGSISREHCPKMDQVKRKK